MKKSMAARITAVLVTILFFSAFSAYGAVEGQYTLFGVTKEGYALRSDELDMRSVLVLTEDGKGSMSMDDETMGVSEWAVTEKEASMMDGGAADSVISVTLEDGSSCSSVVRNGILELDVMGNGEMLMLYALDGADHSAYQLLTVEEYLEKLKEDQNKVPESNTRLYMVWQSLDQNAGIHLSYSEKARHGNGKGSRGVLEGRTVLLRRDHPHVWIFQNCLDILPGRKGLQPGSRKEDCEADHGDLPDRRKGEDLPDGPGPPGDV